MRKHGPTRRAKKLPPLPKTVPHVLGPIAVVIVPDLTDSQGQDCFGLYDAMQRVIKVRAGMDPVVAWSTLWHERTHADLSDLGIQLTEDQEEAICNTIAIARVTEMQTS